MINGLNSLSTFIERKVNSAKQGGRCVTCLSPHASHGLCQGCRDDLPINRWHCHTCALPLAFATEGMRCGECQTSPPPFSRSRIPWRYQFPVDGMIGRYKYHGHRKFVRPLLTDFSQFLEQQLLPGDRPDVLIPAPMHWLRRWQRGFNQAQDIAEFVGARLDIPVAANAVRRNRRVNAQRGLNRAGRLANLANVFQVAEAVPARVAIVDDVVTTGATVRILARALAEAGARDIQVWALARTPG
ncbi:ComF family protein [Marinobacter halophilus]|uniref:ComF family protein n=1 Tax=Marinobacter halophilus TaxID=1323740 RepID=A0A2T1KCN4_9GAMM|nr:ComF family protein [Marinobacter halophilus]PSF07886.1 ComF family protein [Marinobacter halophilus]GGC57952.1 phosphoribosyltransferase [Marinobacter halophilus]